MTDDMNRKSATIQQAAFYWKLNRKTVAKQVRKWLHEGRPGVLKVGRQYRLNLDVIEGGK